MYCGRSKINYAIQPYSQIDEISMQQALRTIKTAKKSEFKQELQFSEAGNLVGSDLQSNPSFSISFNELLKQISIKSKSKHLDFWYHVNDQISLKKGDTIRAGTAILTVHDIYPKKQHDAKQSTKNTIINKNREQHCRICFMSDQTLENPLLSLCKCTGTVKYMHLQCYRQWYHKKVKFYKQRKITYFQLKNIKCELCKNSIPFSVDANGQQYTLLNYKRTFHSPKEMQIMDFGDYHDFSNESLDQFALHDENEQQILDNLSLSNSYLSDNHSIMPGSGNRVVEFQKHPILEQQPQKQGQYILLKSQKINQDNQQIIQVILIRLDRDIIVSFGNQTGIANIIIKNGGTSILHMSLAYANGQIILTNYSNQLGTFIKMSKDKSYEFIGKTGAIIDYQQRQFIEFQTEPWFIPCLQPKTNYVITLIQQF